MIPRRVAALLIGLLLVLAVVFWKDMLGWGPKGEPIPPIASKDWDPATVRKVRKDMTSGGAPCSSCHDGNASEPLQGNPKEHGVFHEGIKLQHGRNQHCFNCHHRNGPENFSNFDGGKIALANVEQLCARCHGTTYRDWLLGAHGRRTGFWDVAKGGPRPTVCIACHDPHGPHFKGFEAAPAPHVNPRSAKRAREGAHH